ncbi:hypothetical protein CH063_08473, partial [Colletotrichum higginsianum]
NPAHRQFRSLAGCWKSTCCLGGGLSVWTCFQDSVSQHFDRLPRRFQIPLTPRLINIPNIATSKERKR